MKYLARTLLLLWALVLLCGCGGGERTSTPSAGPPPQGLVIAGNWQFSTTSMAGMPALTIAGSINQSGDAVSGAVHVDGSNCFDQLTTMGWTGTLTGSNISLTSTSVMGQVSTFTGSIVGTAFTGTYAINGGCADGDQGNVTGIRIPLIADQLDGTFTTSGNATFQVVAQLTQGSASSEGSFGITGTATFSTSCFSSGIITSGTLPSGSFIIGTFVALQIETDNGTLAFHGTANQSTGEISGTYGIFGGTCDQTGTAVLVASNSNPWDY
jgi:hypothetical protein